MKPPSLSYLENWKTLTEKEKEEYCINHPTEVIQLYILGIIEPTKENLALALQHDPETAAKCHKELVLSRKSLESIAKEYPELALLWFPELLTVYEIQDTLKRCRVFDLQNILTQKRTLLVLNSAGMFIPHHLQPQVKKAILDVLHTYQSEQKKPGEIDVEFSEEI